MSEVLVRTLGIPPTNWVVGEGAIDAPPRLIYVQHQEVDIGLQKKGEGRKLERKHAQEGTGQPPIARVVAESDSQV